MLSYVTITLYYLYSVGDKIMKKRGWIKSLMMISQIGLTMMTPIFLCVVLGILLNHWLNTVYYVPIFLFLGIAAAFRNVYLLTKNFYAKDKKKEDEELEYVEALKREGEAKKKLKESSKDGE